ncbi:MFS transporter [Spirosoma pomorum]
MQKTAVSWVIYSTTNSKLMLGISVFATLFPSALLTSIGGVVSDRYDRYKVLLLTQVLSMIQAILLTAVVYFQADAVWTIIGLSVVLGLINGFDVPARQSLVYDLVENKADVPNAVALNSSMVNLSKLIGPALAGLVIETLGEVACFGLNAVSFIAVISTLLMLKLPAFAPRPHPKNILGELVEGFAYAKNTESIRFILGRLALTSLLVLPFTTLMPVYAKDIFHGTASTFGLIDSAIGLGAFVGALYLASLKPTTNLNNILAINTFVFGAGLILFSHAPWYPLALALIAVGAFGMMSQVTITNTLLQTQSAPAMRGRVISLFVMANAGMQPLGSLLVGTISEHVGVQNTVLIQGLLALGIGAFHVRYLRQARRAKTTIKPAPTAVQEATLTV